MIQEFARIMMANWRVEQCNHTRICGIRRILALQENNNTISHIQYLPVIDLCIPRSMYRGIQRYTEVYVPVDWNGLDYHGA